LLMFGNIRNLEPGISNVGNCTAFSFTGVEIRRQYCTRLTTRIHGCALQGVNYSSVEYAFSKMSPIIRVQNFDIFLIIYSV
jgi:hypothetical protein